MSGFCFWKRSKTCWSCGLPCPFDWARTLSVTVACVFALVTLTPTTSKREAAAITAAPSLVHLRRGDDVFPFTGTYLLELLGFESVRSWLCRHRRRLRLRATKCAVAADELERVDVLGLGPGVTAPFSREHTRVAAGLENVDQFRGANSRVRSRIVELPELRVGVCDLRDERQPRARVLAAEAHEARTRLVERSIRSVD